MYRLILRLVRTDTNGNEDPDGSSTWRFRARIDPSLRLQATGNYNLLEGITVSDIGSHQRLQSYHHQLYYYQEIRDLE